MNSGMSTKLPVFDGKNWNRWMKQMLVLFGAQDVLEFVTDGYAPVAADATDAQKLAHKETKKKDQKALFYIHQCVDENVFEKIADSETAKAAWDTLVRCYGGNESVKKVKLQSLRRQYENLNMKNNEKVPEYISRMMLITNEMKACGETLSEQVIIEKVLRSLTPQFDYIVVAIEHSKDLSTMRLDELQSSLEAQELRMTERTSEREEQQALKAASGKKHQKKSWSEAKRSSDGAQKPETSTSDEQKYQKGKERFDKKNVRCYCCQKFGHFASECRSNKERESEEANIARSSDDEPVLLMAYESDDDEPVKLTFSDSEEVSEDEIGVRLYDSESESEVSEDESESEDDSEDEEVSEPESSEDESENDSEDEGSDSEGSDSEDSGSEVGSEGSDSEGSDSEGNSDSEGGDDSDPEDSESQGSEGRRTSDNASEARASEGEASEGTRGSEGDSEEEEDLEGKSDSESDGGDNSDGAFDSDPESSGDSDGGDPDSEDVGFGGQASEFDHAFGGNHDFEGGPSEGGASKGSPASNNGHVSKGETSEGRVSGSIQDSGGQDSRSQDSEGVASEVGCPASDTVPELEEDCDSGIDYGASSEVRSSEFVTTEEILKKQVWLQAMTEELETLRYDFLGPSGVKTNAELIDSDWSEDKNLRRGQVQNEVLEAAHCSAQNQLADALMKDVKAEHFIHLRDGIGVAEIESAEYELRDGAGSNSYSEAVNRRNFCGHYSEAVLLRSSRASEVISQKQKKKQKLKLKLKQKEKQKQKLKLKEKQKARSKQKLLMRIQKLKKARSKQKLLMRIQKLNILLES
ncbi:hypothetical protein P8452_24874 [Trifolium repens]|nr:hypothetical protein P8452_24874 [Trifolium repens]